MRDAKTRAYVEDVLVSALVIEHRLRIKDRMYLAAADIPRGASITPWRLPLNLSIEQCVHSPLSDDGQYFVDGMDGETNT